MSTTANYNFDPKDIADGNYHELYSKRRRDALFCFSINLSNGVMILGRDHLGNVPLFYRVKEGGVQSSIFIEELISGDETVRPDGLRTYLAIGTVKLLPLFREIEIVPPGTVIKIWPDGKRELLYQYHINPRNLKRKTFNACVELADTLLEQAAGRTLKEKAVGLYLSGGIDSFLTGIYLKKSGAEINAYTTAPWGAKSSELEFSSQNARLIGVHSHEIRLMETDRYKQYTEKSTTIYSNPNGSISQMVVACLEHESNIKKERQLYFGQNSDTVTCSVPDQSLLYFLSFLPKIIRRLLHPQLGKENIFDDYVSFRTVGLIHHFSGLERFEKKYDRMKKLSLAGMFFGHTPVDGETMALPAIRRGQIISNLFYDMDVVEFALGIPLRHRLGWSPKSKIYLSLDKRVFKALALRNLPGKIVNRKKGMTVPINRDEISRSFFEQLPQKLGGITLTSQNQRFAAEILKNWTLNTNITPPSLKSLFEERKIECSVGILTFNSGKTLQRALQSVNRCDDIIICDGGSKDETLDIAKKFNVRVIKQSSEHLNQNGTIANFAGVRNQMLIEAKHKWFLYIDSDEYLSKNALDEIEEIVNRPILNSATAYWLPRKTVIKGEIIECASAYPNYQMRLFHRDSVTGFIKQVHERIALKEGTIVGKMQYPEFVPIEISEKEMKQKQLRYLDIEAKKHAEDTFLEWLKGPVKGSLRSSASFLWRHARVLIMCRGKHMPFWIEKMHYWYNWNLIKATGKKFFRWNFQGNQKVEK